MPTICITFCCIRRRENYRHELGLQKVRRESLCSRLRRVICEKPIAFRHELFNFNEALPPSCGEAQPRMRQSRLLRWSMRSRNGETLLVIRSISFAFGVKGGTFALNLPLHRGISPTGLLPPFLLRLARPLTRILLRLQHLSASPHTRTQLLLW